MAKAEKSWEKRLAGEPDELMVDFVESLSVDKRLYKYDIVGSIAHAQMLAEQKLISKNELRQIKSGLIEIGEEIAGGRFKFEKEYEDIHMAIEAALVAKIGEAIDRGHLRSVSALIPSAELARTQNLHPHGPRRRNGIVQCLQRCVDSCRQHVERS